MKELFLPYDLALELKEAGFDELGIAIYPPSKELLIKQIDQEEANQYFNAIIAPLYQQVMNWLRKTHHIHFFQRVYFDSIDKSKDEIYAHDIIRRSDGRVIKGERLPYYESLNKAIEETIKLIKT